MRAIEIQDSDLVNSRFIELIVTAIVAELFGLIGFLLTWIGIALFVPALFDVPNALPTLTIIGGIIYGAMALFRNRILSRIARRGFVFTFRTQRGIRALSWIGIALSIYVTIVAYGHVPNNAYLTLLFAGLFFLLGMPRIIFGRMIRRLREARLCILQFLVELDSGKTNYFWLRKGLPTVERQLRKFDRSVPRGGVYLWACYSLQNNVRVETQLRWLCEWLSRPRITSKLGSLSTSIIVQARAANRVRYKPPKGKRDIPSFLVSTALPFIWKRNDNLFNLLVTFLLSSGILAILSLSSPFPLPFPPWYLQGASLALVASSISIIISLARRKPPARVMDLVSEIHGVTRTVDENFDAGSLLDLIRLLKRKQRTIYNLEPVLRRVAPNVYAEISELLLAIEANIAKQSRVAGGFEIANTLVLIPQTRILISDLRKNSEDWLAQNAYSFDDS